MLEDMNIEIRTLIMQSEDDLLELRVRERESKWGINMKAKGNLSLEAIHDV